MVTGFAGRLRKGHPRQWERVQVLGLEGKIPSPKDVPGVLEEPPHQLGVQYSKPVQNTFLCGRGRQQAINLRVVIQPVSVQRHIASQTDLLADNALSGKGGHRTTTVDRKSVV